jgi:ketol-acid reductoisomerase
MASRSFSKTLRGPLARQVASPRVQQRSFTAARSLVRAAVAARPAAPFQHQQVRGVKTIDFAGVKEDVYGKLPAQSLLATVGITC